MNRKHFLLTKALAATAILAIVSSVRADLTHRYSFSDATDSTNAVDSVGGATGALYPGASFPGDGTVALDGATGFIYLPDDIISNYISFAFEIWTTPATTPTWARLFDFGTNQGGKGSGGAGGTGGNGITWTYVCFNDGNGLFRGDLAAPGAENIIQGPSPAAGSYHDVVLTVDAASKTAALYDNGSRVAFSTNWTVTPQAVGHTYNDYIGRSQWPDPYYNGSIDEFRIYNSPLAPAQVEANFEAGPGSTNASPGTLTSIRFNNPTNTLVGAIITPSLLASYSGLTNAVNITSLPGITYSSGSTNVVALGADGNFHAVGLGTATVQATYQSKTASLTLTVGSEPVVLKHRYSFGEAAGTTAINDSVGGANGTLMNPSATSTLTGTGQLILDGNLSSAYVALPAGMVSSLTNATFQVWATYYGGAVWQELFSFGTNFNGAGVTYTTLIPHNGATGNLRWSINESGESFVDAPTVMAISNEVCVTVAYNYSAQTAALYVGGRKVGSAAMNKALFNIPDVDNFLGRSQFSADPFFQGALDEFRIYSGVKTDLQVAIDAASGPNSTVTDPGNLVSVSLVGPTNVDAHGLALPVQVSANFANVSGLDVTTLPGAQVTSSDPSVLSIVNGNLVPVNAGVATVTGSYSGKSGSLLVTVVDTNAWPTLLHRYSFNNSETTTTPSSATVLTDSVGGSNGTFYGVGTFTGSELSLPPGSFTPNSDGTHNTNNTGYVLLPAGMISTLPSEASFEFWVTYRGGNVWQEMMSFGQGASPGLQLGGGHYLMINPCEGINNDRKLRVEWFGVAGATALVGPTELPQNRLVQVVLTHDQDRQLDRLYVDGQLQASGTVTATFDSLPDTDNYLICDEWPDPNFNGSYNEFRIWNGALTAGQIATLFSAGPDVISGPQLKIVAAGGNITLQWPANATGFALQSSSSLASRNWSAVSGTPVVINGVNNVTLAAGQSPVFYRLKQ